MKKVKKNLLRDSLEESRLEGKIAKENDYYYQNPDEIVRNIRAKSY